MCGRRLRLGSAYQNPLGGVEAGIHALRHCLGGARGCWLPQPAQAQLLKIRVENLSPWLVLQEPVALATPSQSPPSRLGCPVWLLVPLPALCPILLGREEGVWGWGWSSLEDPGGSS